MEEMTPLFPSHDETSLSILLGDGSGERFESAKATESSTGNDVDCDGDV